MNLVAATLTAAIALCPAPPPEVDGFAVTHVPAGVGTQVGEFAYEWEDVGFRSRVWERGPDADGAFGVDLTVKVLRGDRLADAAATRTFLAEYHEQDPAGWLPFDHHGQPGWSRPDAVFWQAAPGVAVEVTIDGARFGEQELGAVALGVGASGGGTSEVGA